MIIPIGTSPVAISQSAGQACLIVNAGPGTVFLDGKSGVSASSYSLTLAPKQSVSWSGGALWAICASGNASTLTLMDGASASNLGQIDANVTGTVDVGPNLAPNIATEINTAGVPALQLNDILYQSLFSTTTPPPNASVNVAQYSAITIKLSAAMSGLSYAQYTAKVKWYADGVLIDTQRLTVVSCYGAYNGTAYLRVPTYGDTVTVDLSSFPGGVGVNFTSLVIVGHTNNVEGPIYKTRFDTAGNMTQQAPESMYEKFTSIAMNTASGGGAIQTRSGRARVSVSAGVGTFQLTPGIATLTGVAGANVYADVIFPDYPVSLSWSGTGGASIMTIVWE